VTPEPLAARPERVERDVHPGVPAGRPADESVAADEPAHGLARLPLARGLERRGEVGAVGVCELLERGHLEDDRLQHGHVHRAVSSAALRLPLHPLPAGSGLEEDVRIIGVVPVAADREATRLMIRRRDDQGPAVGRGEVERDADGLVVSEDVVEVAGRVIPVAGVVDPPALYHEEEAGVVAAE
jgi:hypothetical protein